MAGVAALFAALILASKPRLYRLGFLIFLGFSAHHIFRTFPYTINHMFLETVFIAVLVLFPARETTDSGEALVDGTATRILQIGILAVWFFSGVQKIVQGYYLSGEMFAFQTLFQPDGDLALALRKGFAFLSRYFETPFARTALPIAVPELFQNAHLAFSGVEKAYFMAPAWLIVIAEVFLPVAFLRRSLRNFAVTALVGCQMLVGWMASEYDFSLTGLAILFSFFPDRCRQTYPALAIAALGYFIFESVGRG